MELEPSALPIGRSGTLEALPLTMADDHAVLVRETGSPKRPRTLLSADRPAGGERLVITPLDDDVEVRVDGDALAVWLGEGSLLPTAAEGVPAWASLVGLVLLLAVAAFAVLGSVTFFGWLLNLLGPR